MTAALDYAYESLEEMTDEPKKKQKGAPEHLRRRYWREAAIKAEFRSERKVKGYTQDETAQRGYVERTNVSDAENGRTHDILMLWDVADALGINLSLLVDRMDVYVETREREFAQGRIPDPVEELGDDS